jgi:hypothetical protein
VANWLGERVGVTFNDEEDDSIPVETLKELRNYVSLSGEPVFQLQVTGPGMFQSMQDYSTHWINKPEPLTPQLTCDHAKHARHLFGLIHLNSPLSSGCVEQLKAIFALLEERNTQEWKENEELMRICKQGVDMEIDAALGLQAWIHHLSDDTQTLVGHQFALLQARVPYSKYIIEELIKLFKPDNGSWEQICSTKSVFDQARNDAGFG